MTKYILIFFFLILVTEAQTQIQKIELRDSVILKIIDSYITKQAIPNDRYGVFLIELRVDDSLLKPITLNNYERFDLNKTEELTASYSGRILFTRTIHGIEVNPPDFYILYKNRPVLFYSGINFLVIRSKKEVRNLIKDVERILSTHKKDFYFEPESKEFIVTNKQFTLN